VRVFGSLRPLRARSYATAFVIVALFTAAGIGAKTLLADADLSMLLLLGVVIVAYREPLGPALVATALSVGAFNFFFVPPFHTLHVSDTRYLVTFAAMAGMGVTVSSLTSRLRDRERAAHAANLRAKAEQIRNGILSSVSHDLRTPLGSIIGAATALRGGAIDADARDEMIDTILEEGNHLLGLLDNLLRMMRLSGEEHVLNEDWHVPEEIVGSALGRLGEALAHHEVRTSIDPRVGLAQFDGVLIELALVNLVDNAAKFSPRATSIEITIACRDAELVWEVADEGPGVPMDEREKVFQKFYRGAGRGERGSGLGLAIAKAIVEAHGGRVWVDARHDRTGAVFGFAVPLEASAPEMPGERVS
jgi:two-component system, OmpR family, sensor histidine kinase KdpD